MRLTNDDDLSKVDDVFLGPPGWSLPFRVRYRAYGLGAAVFVVVLVLMRRLEGGTSLMEVVWSLFITIAVTTSLMRLVTPDRPLRAIAAMFGAELRGPRTPAPVSVRWDPSRVRRLPKGDAWWRSLASRFVR